MIEIYIFVNPIDYTKRDSLMNLFNLIQKSSQNIKFQIVPLATLPLMDQYFNAHLIPRSNLEKRNFLFNKAHQIALYYETLVTISKNVAIDFLFNSLELLENDNYDFDSIHQLFNNIGDNCCSCFDKYYQNYIEIAKEKNASNLLLLNELGIQNLSSLVIYNFNSTSAFAIRLDSLNDFQLIKSLIESTSIQDALKQQEINY